MPKTQGLGRSVNGLGLCTTLTPISKFRFKDKIKIWLPPCNLQTLVILRNWLLYVLKSKWRSKELTKNVWWSWETRILTILKLKNKSKRRSGRDLSKQITKMHLRTAPNSLDKSRCSILKRRLMGTQFKHLWIRVLSQPSSRKNVQKSAILCTC